VTLVRLWQSWGLLGGTQIQLVNFDTAYMFIDTTLAKLKGCKAKKLPIQHGQLIPLQEASMKTFLNAMLEENLNPFSVRFNCTIRA